MPKKITLVPVPLGILKNLTEYTRIGYELTRDYYEDFSWDRKPGEGHLTRLVRMANWYADVGLIRAEVERHLEAKRELLQSADSLIAAYSDPDK